MRIPTPLFLLFATVLLAGCTAVREPRLAADASPVARAQERLRLARKVTLEPERRAAHYLSAAALVSPLLESQPNPARTIYNQAAAELADFLQETQDGAWWNRPLTLANGQTYRLRFTPGTTDGTWSPREFTDFKPAQNLRRRHLRKNFAEEGVGGTLVGIQKAGDESERRRRFQPGQGLVAPVTATLDFRGQEATLSLLDPALQRSVTIAGRTLPLAADFSAPLATYPVRNELWNGFLGMVRVERYLNEAGLYLLHPYDARRVLVILVHGLASTPQMWTNVANEVEADPALRGKVQFAVFQYPTGNPVIYSAMRFREDLTRFHRQHPGTPVVLIGHSMGGLVSRLQVTEPGRAIWNANFRDSADRLLTRLPPEALVKRAMLFHRDPEVRRVVFICVPHRGSDLAISSIGHLAIRLISLPATLVGELTETLGDVLQTVGGKPQIPTSINSLSPRSPTLLALEGLPILAPHHSIIGDRGRGNSPESSDGVVPYRSSHLASAESELIVPGPHGSHELPQTVDELKRILRLQLGSRPTRRR